jgi:two-component system phosphate regulon sensor histidine kinase PhoR
MFGVDREKSEGRLIQEVIRNVDLHKQIERILHTGISFEDEIILDSTANGNTYLQTNVVSLQGHDSKSQGALIVLNDVTRLRKLESMRSDFVANVSHELKTPITSIRGYVETMLDGALDDREDSEKFLEIVLRQSGQLEEIIDDLLALSRIERHTNEAEVSFETRYLKPVLEEALDVCASKAEKNHVEMVLDCPDELNLKLNQTLLEQAVVNLLVNAVTYSEAGQQIVLRAAEYEEGGRLQTAISVIDHGIGIGEKHLPRLFERFYRSDRARSRKAGGTGLGLAIVKHIVQAHGGRVEVQSAIGEGSTFTLILPSS